MGQQQLQLKQVRRLDTYDAAYLEPYLETGTGSPILFLHGFLGEGSCWSPIMAQLPQSRCIALDLLGFGASSKPDLCYNIWHQVAFVHQFVQQLGIQRFWLVGHSYGGWTAAAYAIAIATQRFGLPHAQTDLPSPHPTLEGLILIAPAGIRDDQFVGRYAHLRPLLWETIWIDWTMRAIQPLMQRFGHQHTFEQIYQFRQAIREQPVAKSFLRDRLKPEDAIDTVDPALNAIITPTLVIAAQQDTTIPLWHCQTYANGIANAQLKIYENADHGLLQTHAAPLAQHITEFIQPSVHLEPESEPPHPN